MYIVRDYMTDEIVAICSRKADAMAFVNTELDEKKCIIEEKNSKKRLTSDA